jgi:hypothetical protein
MSNDNMTIRCEFWFTDSDRNIFRRNAAPAIHITTPTVEPVPLPSFGGNRLVLDMRAVRGNIAVEIGTTEHAVDYDPQLRGRMLLAGESQRFLVAAESYMMVHEWIADSQ